jgi:hypothetical protein
VVALGIVLVPTYLLGDAVVDSVENAVTVVKSGDFRVPPPAEAVAAWPLVGKRLYELWMHAATDLTGFCRSSRPRSGDSALLFSPGSPASAWAW